MSGRWQKNILADPSWISNTINSINAFMSVVDIACTLFPPGLPTLAVTFDPLDRVNTRIGVLQDYFSNRLSEAYTKSFEDQIEKNTQFSESKIWKRGAMVSEVINDKVKLATTNHALKSLIGNMEDLGGQLDGILGKGISEAIRDPRQVHLLNQGKSIRNKLNASTDRLRKIYAFAISIQEKI